MAALLACNKLGVEEEEDALFTGKSLRAVSIKLFGKGCPYQALRGVSVKCVIALGRIRYFPLNGGLSVGVIKRFWQKSGFVVE